jgi:hypothetical protein
MFARPIVKSVLETEAADEAVVLEKTYGETSVRGRGRLEEPMWDWPRR